MKNSQCQRKRIRRKIRKLKVGTQSVSCKVKVAKKTTQRTKRGYGMNSKI